MFNIVVERFKNSQTELPDLSNYVQRDEHTTKNAHIMTVTHSLSTSSMKIAINWRMTLFILAQWSTGGNISSFHFVSKH